MDLFDQAKRAICVQITSSYFLWSSVKIGMRNTILEVSVTCLNVLE